MKIIFTTDLHGYISPYLYSNKQLAKQGLSRLASFIRENKDENTLLIDNGDILQGSPLTYYHHLFNEEKINPMALCLNELKYDYYNIGNHDFNYHQDVLKRFIDDLDAQCITGNIEGSDTFKFNYKKHRIENKDVIIIGATNDYISNWELQENIEGLSFKNAFDFVYDTIQYLKKNEKWDYLIVVYHGGFEKNLDGSELEIPSYDNQGYKIINEIEEIDLFLTGHQHRSIINTINDTHIMQATYNGMELAFAEIDLNTKKINSKLVKADFEIDQNIMDLIHDEESQTQVWLDNALGNFKDNDCLVHDEYQARFDKHEVVSFLNQIQLDHYKADLSAISLFNQAKGFNQCITMRDVVSTYVYPNTLIKVKINGEQLKRYLENAAKYFALDDNEIVVSNAFINPKPLHFEYDMIDGIDYVIKVSNPIGNRIISMSIDGKEISNNDDFTMVVNNYRYAGGGNYDVLKELEVLADDGKEMVEIIAEYIMNNSPVTINHKKNITLEK